MGQVMKVLHVLRKLGFYPISDKELVKIFFFFNKAEASSDFCFKDNTQGQG